ncbi:MAG TPA: hypothetical protein VLX61_10660 [Anaerolineales bacterium]|nr:hypothetical protein [Anaerolineales bacterium]
MTEPTQVIPTNRVSYDKQREVLKAFAVIGNGGKVVTIKSVSEAVTLTVSAVRSTTDFFASIGLLKEVSGGFVIAKEVNDYYIADQAGESNAYYRIRPLLEKTWFANALMPKLQLKDISELDAVTALSISSSADKEYRGRIKMLLRLMEDAGMIVTNGNNISRGQSIPLPTSEIDEPQIVFTTAKDKMPLSKSVVGGVQLNFSIHVDSDDFSKWSPDRISAFFGGLAQVLAAKAALDQEDKNE